MAVLVGLFLQAALFGHGAFTTLGVNTCVMAIPALLAWLLFAGLRRMPWVRQLWFRAGLVAISVVVLLLSASYSVVVLITRDFAQAGHFTLQPVVLLATLVLAVVAAWAERRLDNGPEFPLGLLVGETAVLVTIFLNSLALLWGGKEDQQTVALLTFVIHLPLAVIEGIVLGFTVGFLVRVKPEMLGWINLEKKTCSAEPLS